MCLECHSSCSRNMVLPEMSGLIAEGCFCNIKASGSAFCAECCCDVPSALKVRHVMTIIGIQPSEIQKPIWYFP